MSKSPRGAGTVLAFCVRSIEGDRTSSVSGSEEIGSKGLAFIIAMTSDMRVVKTSWVRRERLFFSSSASRMRRAVLIILSQAPPI